MAAVASLPSRRLLLRAGRRTPLPWLLLLVIVLLLASIGPALTYFGVPAQWEKAGKTWANFAKDPSGTGPFKTAGWTRGVKVETEVHAAYWGGTPKIKGIFEIWQGGLGIWGGVLLGTIVGAAVVRRAGANVPAFLDAAAPGLLLAQGIGRIGNWWNQELFGKPTSLPWGLEIDIAHRPLDFISSATFHPTFLYELLWDLAGVVLLVWLGRRLRVAAPGLFCLYVAYYCFGRFFEELLREGHLLISRHSRRWLKSEQYLPGPVIDRANRGRWLQEGALTLGERARREKERLVAEWQPSRLPDGVKAELRPSHRPRRART